MFKNQSSLYKFSNPISGTIATSIKISPSSEYIAVANGVKLNIYNSHNGKLLQSYPCLDKIDYCSFSCDSDKILCFLKERNVVQAFSVSDKEWKCRINEGSPGIINAYWSSNGCYIITESDFGIQLVIWSLLANQSVSKFIISSPKPNLWNMSKDSCWSPSLTAFSSSKPVHNVISTHKLSNKNNNNNSSETSTTSTIDINNYTSATTETLLASNLFAVVHRYELHDYIAVYSCQNTSANRNNNNINNNNTKDSPMWEELSKFQCRSNDVACIQWLPHKALILAIDSPLTYNISLYTPAGEVIGMYSAYQHCLGIRSVAAFTECPMIPFPTTQQTLSQQFIAAGSYDGKIRLLSCHSVQEVFVLHLIHPREMEAGLVKTSLYTNTLTNSSSTTTSTTATATAGYEEGVDIPPLSSILKLNEMIATDGAIFVETHQIANTNTTINGINNNNSSFITGSGNNSRRHSQQQQQQYSSASSSYVIMDHSNVEITSYNQYNSSSGAALRRRLAETTTANTAGTSNMNTADSFSNHYLSKAKSTQQDDYSTEQNTMFIIQNSLRTLPRVTQLDPRDPKQALKMGVTWQGWSADGEYLAAREETQPRCLWIFSIKSSSSGISSNNNNTMHYSGNFNHAEVNSSVGDMNGMYVNATTNTNNRSSGVKFHHVFVAQDSILSTQWRPNPLATCTTTTAPVPATQNISNGIGSYNNSISGTNVAVVVPLLAFCTGTSRVYFWNPLDNDSYPYYEDVPIVSNDTSSNNSGILSVTGKSGATEMNGVHRLEWSNDGTFLTLFGRDSFVICHVDV